jgi:hypothetical protein
MKLRDLAHKRLPVDTWLTAYRDDHAWRWTADSHYAFLRDAANELLHRGDVSPEARTCMALEAFRSYQFHIRNRVEAETTYVWRYEYEVIEEGRVIATIGSEGHLFAIGSGVLLGCIGHHYGPEAEHKVTRWVDYAEELVGYLRGLVIERAAAPAWVLALKLQAQPPKRWATHAIHG